MTAAEKLAIRLEAERIAYLRAKREAPRAEPSNRASMIGHPCERYLVYMRTSGHLLPMVTETTQAIFEEGKHHELSVRKVLAEMGFDLQAAQLGFPANNWNITGHVDGALLEDGTLVVVESKGVNEHDWHKIQSFGIEWIRDAKRTWLAKWYTQLQTYLFLMGVEHAVWILKSKQTGMWTCQPVTIDYSYVEKLLDRIERVNVHVLAGTLPGFHNDPEICSTCPFQGRTCHPPFKWDGDVIEFDDNDEMPEVFREWEALNALVGTQAKRLEQLKKACQRYVRRRVSGSKKIAVGSVVVTVTSSPRRGHYVPPSDGVRVELRGATSGTATEEPETGLEDP